MDFGGALAAAVINAAGADDLVGFRHGFLLSDSSGDRCCPFPGFNRDYSNEIYTADLQLAGVARRLGVKIGPIKYLLLSVTYGTKRYPGGADGQRQVGFELGLNFSQMLNDLDVTRRSVVGLSPARRVRQRAVSVHRRRVPLRPQSRALVRAERRQQRQLI